MEKSDIRYQAYVSILEEELKPAMGCTEPIAIAYCAAVAREVLGGLPEKVKVGASGSMIKNVKSVIVPNTDHLKGIPAAAAAGIVAGDPKKELEVIASVTKEQITAMKEFLQTTPVEVEHIDNGITFDIIVTLTRGTDTSMVRIANYHTNVVHIEKNGEVIRDIPVNGEEEEGLTDRSLLDMEHIWDFIHTVDVNDIREVLERQKTYNMAIAREGMRGQYGSNIGALLLDMNGNDVRTRARAMDVSFRLSSTPAVEIRESRLLFRSSYTQRSWESMKIPCTGRWHSQISRRSTRRRPSEDFPPTAAQSVRALVPERGSRISPERPTMRWSTP